MHFSTIINAPAEKVWNAMLGDETYRAWTEPFHHGSRYEGGWEKGSNIRFLAPEEDGKVSGMFSRIAENRRHEYISIEHLGEIKDDKEVETEWKGAHENYTFKEKDRKTELLVDMDADDEFKEMFENIWPEALKKLKAIAEA